MVVFGLFFLFFLLEKFMFLVMDGRERLNTINKRGDVPGCSDLPFFLKKKNRQSRSKLILHSLF